VKNRAMGKPQGVDKDEPLLPCVAAAKQELSLLWSGVVCILYSAQTGTLILTALASSNIGPRWDHPDPQELGHDGSATMLVFFSVIAEACFLASSTANTWLIGAGLGHQLQRHGIGDSMLTLMEYGCKIAYALHLSLANGGIIHTDVQALGGPRPVYFDRFAQWSIAVPI